MSIHGDTKHILACIQACVEAQDGRGRWRPMRTLLAALRSPMQESQVIAQATANAAVNFGAWLAAWKPAGGDDPTPAGQDGE